MKRTQYLISIIFFIYMLCLCLFYLFITVTNVFCSFERKLHSLFNLLKRKQMEKEGKQRFDSQDLPNCCSIFFLTFFLPFYFEYRPRIISGSL